VNDQGDVPLLRERIAVEHSAIIIAPDLESQRLAA